MNPRSDAPSSGGQPAPLPTHTHELTQTEILELGVLAVEEPHEDAAEVAPMGIPATSPLPPTTVITPQLTAPAVETSAPASQPAQPVMKRGVLQPLTAAPQQAAPSASAAAPQPIDDKKVPDQPVPAPQPEPSVAGAPKATPSKAPDIARPAQLTPLVVQQPEAAVDQPKPPIQLSSSEPMELSANSMNLKSISRLHALGIAMNVLVVILIIGVLAGGWYVYTYVLNVQAPINN